jgi:SAM-dependent methyltransferase
MEGSILEATNAVGRCVTEEALTRFDTSPAASAATAMLFLRSGCRVSVWDKGDTTVEARDAYTDSFIDRGSKYDKAMRLFPDSRREEFTAVLNELSISDQGLVLDVPAGGRYLQHYLPARFTYLPHEPVVSFSGRHVGDTDRGLLPIPHATGSVDVVVSVAGVHHFEDKRPLFEEMNRVTRPGGKLLLADVHRLSHVARFLDGYIDSSNSMGHRGYYLDDTTLDELDLSGWEVRGATRKHYHWHFPSQQALVQYCHLLFDITHGDHQRTGQQVEQILGTDVFPNGRIAMRWDLYVISARKRSLA